MVQAAVGFQCPDCTHSNPQKVVNSRQLFGRGGTSEVIVGKVLIGLNVAAYLMMAVVGGADRSARTAEILSAMVLSVQSL